MRPLAAAIGHQEFAAAETPAMDEEAFRLFYARTARPLRAYIAATLHNRALVDDLLQESFLRFLQAELPAEDEHRKNYLFRIATNLMRDHFRRARAVPPLGEAASGERLDDHIARREDLRRIMEELNPRQRDLLWLAYVEQFSHGEIAGMVGAKTASIRPMLARARQSLAELLRKRTGAWK
jgi:RNA polymerase sigma-70 factor (ECF subfamily)